MTAHEKTLPLYRTIAVADIPERGLEVHFQATADELKAVASWIDAPSVAALTAQYKLRHRGSQVRLDGELFAKLTRICVVTLEPFETEIREPVSMRLSEHGRIDIGAVTAEFLALGLDPHPRKSEAAFAYTEDAGKENPFAALAGLKPKAGS